MKFYITVLMLLVGLPAFAKEPYTLGSDGLYTGGDGAKYVRKDNWAWVAPTSYTYCGRCYSNAGYWKFTGYEYTKYEAKVADPAAEYDYFRNRIADALVIKTKQEADLILRANIHNQTMELMQEAGVTGLLKGSGLLPALATPYRNAIAYGVSGNTVYAAAPQQSLIQADFYGAFDRNVFMQQASAYALAGQASNAEAHRLNLVSADKMSAYDARIAEIFVKGAAASQVLNAAAPAPSASIRESHIGPAVGPPLPQQQIGPRKIAAMRSCVQCHGDQNPQGGFRISSYWSLPQEEQLRIVGKLLERDTRSREFMPRGQPRLPSSVIAEFLPNERVAQ